MYDRKKCMCNCIWLSTEVINVCAAILDVSAAVINVCATVLDVSTACSVVLD